MTPLGIPKGSHKLQKREKRPFQNQTKKTHEKKHPKWKRNRRTLPKVTTLPLPRQSHPGAPPEQSLS